jgi:type I restriction enzyme S subunit
MVGEVAIEVRSGFASGKHNTEGRGVPHLRPMNVSRLGEIELDEVKYVDPEKDERRLAVGDVLFNNTNSPALVGKTAVVRRPGEFAFSNHMTRVRVHPSINSDFVAAQLHFLWLSGQLAPHINNHVNQASISAKKLETQVVLRVAPTEEQTRIVEAIDQHLSQCDSAARSLESAAARIDGLRKGTIASALSEGEWATVSWGEVGEALSGRTFPSTAYQDDGTRLLRPGNLGKSGRVTWRPDTTRHLPTEYGEKHPKYVLRGTHLLMNLTAQSLADDFLGRVCLSSPDDEFLLNQRIARLSSGVASSTYLFWVFRSQLFREFVARLNTGSLIQHISTKQLQEFRFPLPPPIEQERIVARCAEEVGKIDRLEAALYTAHRRAGPIRRQVLSTAFSGQLVPRDPSNEPASELLERIRAERSAKKRRSKKKVSS